MKEFRGKVAVVTGAASGIGRGMAGRFAEEGMRLVLADIEREPLLRAEKELEQAGAEVLAVETDVSSRASLEALAARTLDRFGKVHVLCNNAGVAGGGGPLWQTTEQDWAWLLGVNLLGVVYGIQVFVPTMLAQNEEGHVVNTSSVLGLSTGTGSPYGVSKHAVTRLTEGLHYDLLAAGSKLRASVLCPGMIATRIVSAHRNRPRELQNQIAPAVEQEFAARREEVQKRFLELGMPPDEVGSMVVDAIREERFYILTHPSVKERVEVRMKDILEDRCPSPLPPMDLAAR